MATWYLSKIVCNQTIVAYGSVQASRRTQRKSGTLLFTYDYFHQRTLMYKRISMPNLLIIGFLKYRLLLIERQPLSTYCLTKCLVGLQAIVICMLQCTRCSQQYERTIIPSKLRNTDQEPHLFVSQIIVIRLIIQFKLEVNVI